MPIPKLKRALELREQIDTLTMELNGLVGDNGFIPHNGNGGRTHTLRAQNLHWPARNGHGTNGHIRKTRLSPQGRAKVSAAVKARWARYRAAKARAGRGK